MDPRRGFARPAFVHTECSHENGPGSPANHPKPASTVLSQTHTREDRSWIEVTLGRIRSGQEEEARGKNWESTAPYCRSDDDEQGKRGAAWMVNAISKRWKKAPMHPVDMRASERSKQV